MTSINTQSHFDADGDNSAQVCRTSAGFIDYIHVVNPNNADAFLQLFDLPTGSVTVGTTTPTQSYIVPAGDGTNDGAFAISFPTPVQFRTAITYACTTTATGNTDPSTGLTVNIVHH